MCLLLSLRNFRLPYILSITLTRPTRRAIDTIFARLAIMLVYESF